MKIPNALFHCDVVQALGKIPIDVKHLDVDLLSLSSHKIYGPKGVGAIYSRDRDQLSPLIDGGGQENSLRSGTENVYGIVGFGEACRIASVNLTENCRNIKSLRDYLIERVLSTIPRSYVNGSWIKDYPITLILAFQGLRAKT